MAIHKNGMRTLLGRGPQGQGGVHAKLARLIRCRGDYATFIALPAYDNGFALELGIEQLFHGHKECIHIDVEDKALGRHPKSEDTTGIHQIPAKL
jgi:hypothetical protein